MEYEPQACEYGGVVRWTWYFKQSTNEPWALPPAVFDQLKGGYPYSRHREYRSRESALAALADALKKFEKSARNA